MASVERLIEHGPIVVRHEHSSFTYAETYNNSSVPNQNLSNVASPSETIAFADSGHDIEDDFMAKGSVYWRIPKYLLGTP